MRDEDVANAVRPAGVEGAMVSRPVSFARVVADFGIQYGPPTVSRNPPEAITGLSAGTTYSFTVAAVDAAGNASALSAPLSVTTAAPSDTTAPTTPAGLAASAVTST